jgi:hypothetical protein
MHSKTHPSVPDKQGGFANNRCTEIHVDAGAHRFNFSFSWAAVGGLAIRRGILSTLWLLSASHGAYKVPGVAHLVLHVSIHLHILVQGIRCPICIERIGATKFVLQLRTQRDFSSLSGSLHSAYFPSWLICVVRRQPMSEIRVVIRCHMHPLFCSRASIVRCYHQSAHVHFQSLPAVPAGEAW